MEDGMGRGTAWEGTGWRRDGAGIGDGMEDRQVAMDNRVRQVEG